MELGGRALPLTRGQLEIWLAQETGHSSTEWQLGLFVTIEGRVERDALQWAIRQAVQEAEPARVAFFGGRRSFPTGARIPGPRAGLP